MAIESRTAFKINEGQSSPEEQSGEPFLVEPPTVMNVTAAFMDMPKEVKANVEKARSETVAKLWRVTEQMNILYPDNWTRIASEEILWFQDQLTKALMLELTMAKKQQQKHKHKTQSRTQASQQYFYDHMQRPQKGPFIKQPGEWTFGRGFLYSVSLLTTVGKCNIKILFSDHRPMQCHLILAFITLLSARLQSTQKRSQTKHKRYLAKNFYIEQILVKETLQCIVFVPMSVLE